MSANVANQVAFLRTSREFPEDLHQLTIEVNKSYVDTANAVNFRTIGLFPTNIPAITGESWFLTTSRQQTLRRVYTFSSTASITHNISVTNPTQFVRAFGTYTDGTNSYGLIYGSNGAFANQISFYITSTQIIFVTGTGSPPTVTSGTIILEWLSSA